MTESNKKPILQLSEGEVAALLEPFMETVVSILTGSKKARLNIVPYLVNVGVNARQDAIAYTVELEVTDNGETA
jgi:hypothetical protein